MRAKGAEAYEDLTVRTRESVAAELGVSVSRVGEIERNAIRKLRIVAGTLMRALLVAMQEQEPVQVGGRMTRRSQ